MSDHATGLVASGAGSPSYRWLNLALLAALPLGVLVLAVPALAAIAPRCVFRELTGLYCPGCGTGHAVQALLRGDLGAALRQNAFTVLALVPVTLALMRETAESFGLVVPRRLVTDPRWPIALAAVVVAFWVLRNVPVWPFALLAPR